MSKHILSFSLLGLLLVFAGCASQRSMDSGKAIKSASVGNLTVTLSNSSGQLKHGSNDLLVTFKDSSGSPVDVGAASLTFHMPQMGSMTAMNNQATLTTTETPGIYKAKTDVEMPGEWQAQVTFEGPAGKGQTSFPVTVQ
jgi:hypothetical protein